MTVKAPPALLTRTAAVGCSVVMKLARLKKKKARTRKKNTQRMVTFVRRAAMRNMSVRKHHRIRYMPRAKVYALSLPLYASSISR